MVLDAKSFMSGELWFKLRRSYQMFDSMSIIEGHTAEEVVSLFNKNKSNYDTLRLLRNCDGLSVLEMTVICDNTNIKILGDDKSSDNLLRMRARVIPCIIKSNGKICLNTPTADSIQKENRKDG